MQTSSERDVLDKIRCQPYYAVRFVPASVDLELQKSRIRTIVTNDAVRLRGWDFPCDVADVMYNGQSFVGAFIDWSSHVEAWRFYASGQFVYFGNPWDLAMDLQQRVRADFDKNVLLAHPSQRDTVAGVFSFVGLIYSITEFYLFASRLTGSLEQQDAMLEVSMRNIDRWALTSGQPGVPFYHFYQARVNNITLRPSGGPSLLSDPVGAANNGLRELFDIFNWDAAESMIRDWQDRLTSRRFAN